MKQALSSEQFMDLESLCFSSYSLLITQATYDHA